MTETDIDYDAAEETERRYSANMEKEERLIELQLKISNLKSWMNAAIQMGADTKVFAREVLSMLEKGK